MSCGLHKLHIQCLHTGSKPSGLIPTFNPVLRSAPIRTHRLRVLNGAEKDEGSATLSQSETRETVTSKPKPNPERLKLQKVERLDDSVWAGVAAVDRGDDPRTSLGCRPLTAGPTDCHGYKEAVPSLWSIESMNVNILFRKTAVLVGGDLAAILIFAAIGRSGHGESLDFPSVLKTAAPFLIGWFGAADLQKAFGEEAQGGDILVAAKKAAIVWATGIPVGIGVRTAQRGYLPDLSFVIVTMVVTLVFLVGWRTVAAALTPSEDLRSSPKAAQRRRDKQGNPLEFLQLLASLTKRW